MSRASLHVVGLCIMLLVSAINPPIRSAAAPTGRAGRSETLYGLLAVSIMISILALYLGVSGLMMAIEEFQISGIERDAVTRTHSK